MRDQRKFVHDACHGLRDPLTICRVYLETLRGLPEEQGETVALVIDELDRMARMVADLELLADAEQPDFLRPEWIELDLFAHELTAKASTLASSKWQLDQTAEGTFFADRKHLTQAVMNLAHNAVEHGHPDEVAIGAALTEDECRIWVHDTGTGMSDSDQAQIFDCFTRGRGAHRHRYRGGGLGLAIVKAITEAHGGRVELESRPGEGSTFTIVVPRQPLGR